jgi:hypothetical protein
LRHYATSWKVAGHIFESGRGHPIVSTYPVLPAALEPGVYSASNRNEYQKQKNNVSGANAIAVDINVI